MLESKFHIVVESSSWNFCLELGTLTDVFILKVLGLACTGLDRRAETSRLKWCFSHKAEILPLSRKPVGRKYHKAEKFMLIALLITNYYMTEYYFNFVLSTNYFLTAFCNQPFIS